MKRSLILHCLALGISVAFIEGYKVLAKPYSNAYPVAEMPSLKKWTSEDLLIACKEYTMSTMENYWLTISALNNRMWAQAKPLEKQLRDLETEYQAASRRPITDVVSRGVATLLLPQINATAAKLNAVYDDWQRTLSLITPPPPTINPNTFPPPPSPGKLSARIPWPQDLPLEVRRQLSRIIDQGGIPLSKRVAVTVAKAPYGGGGSVVVEFAKW